MKNIYKYFVYSIFIFINIVYSQNLNDINKMKNEYEKLKLESSRTSLSTIDYKDSEIKNNIPNETFIIPYSRKEEVKVSESYFFGYDFFTNRDSLTLWENLPTPPAYQLGPGDELIISLWGETQLREVYTISREGNIYDNKVGLLNLSGRSISSAKEYLNSQFGRIYSTLSTSKPTTFIDVSLGRLKSINVNFVGHVKYPGIHTIHPFSDLITGLIQAGGVDTSGSLRKVVINRVNEDPINIDLYDYFIKGKHLPKSAQLKNQDIVMVSPRSASILIDSAIVKPGYYESLPGETVYDIIQYAGGPKFDFSYIISMKKLKLPNNRQNGLAYENSYIRYEESKSIRVNTGDMIELRRFFDENQYVEIIGQVKSPGIYNYYQGFTLNDLLLLAGGFDDSTYIKSIYKDKAEIIRRNPKGRYDEVIPINLNTYLDDANNETILLQNLDRVVIHSNLNFFEKENILITGEVNVPGSYPLISDNESLESFLNRAGGLTSKALSNGINIYRDKNYFISDAGKNFSSNNSLLQNIEDDPTDKLRVAWQNKNISLMPGDSIVVKEKTATVLVTGAVYNPGVLEYRDKESLRFYLNAAGGLTNEADRSGIIVLYANGIVSPKKWYLNPKVLDGSTIIVNKKLPEEPFDLTQFATNWTSIISSIITTVILSQQLSGSNN